MGNCTSGLDTLPIGPKGLLKKALSGGNLQDMFEKCISSPDMEEQLQKLIQSNVDVNYRMEDNAIGSCCPIHIAAKVGNVTAIQMLIKANADLESKDVKGQTALLWAIEESHNEVAEELIKAGADVNTKSDDGTTPLLLAINKNNKEMTDFLIQNGAEVNAASGEAPLVAAVKVENEAAICSLLKAKASYSGLDFGADDEGKQQTLQEWATTRNHQSVLDALQETETAGETPEGDHCIENMEKEINDDNETGREIGDGAEDVKPEEVEAPEERSDADGGAEGAEADEPENKGEEAEPENKEEEAEPENKEVETEPENKEEEAAEGSENKEHEAASADNDGVEASDKGGGE